MHKHKLRLIESYLDQRKAFVVHEAEILTTVASVTITDDKGVAVLCVYEEKYRSVVNEYIKALDAFLYRRETSWPESWCDLLMVRTGISLDT